MYTSKNFEYLVGLNGFSDTMLKNHFTLYEGYVTNTNKLLDIIKTKEGGTPEYNELKRRYGWEWNGMRLHELYFGNLTKEAKNLSDGELKGWLTYTWGSFANWEKDFRSTATMRGIGWVVLYLDVQAHTVFNAWVTEHDMGHLAHCVPLLVMDVWEHAYITDYGIKRADYVTAFMNAIDWAAVEKRAEEAMKK